MNCSPDLLLKYRKFWFKNARNSGDEKFFDAGKIQPNILQTEL